MRKQDFKLHSFYFKVVKNNKNSEKDLKCKVLLKVYLEIFVSKYELGLHTCFTSTCLCLRVV